MDLNSGCDNIDVDYTAALSTEYHEVCEVLTLGENLNSPWFFVGFVLLLL